MLGDETLNDLPSSITTVKIIVSALLVWGSIQDWRFRKFSNGIWFFIFLMAIFLYLTDEKNISSFLAPLGFSALVIVFYLFSGLVHPADVKASIALIFCCHPPAFPWLFIPVAFIAAALIHFIWYLNRFFVKRDCGEIRAPFLPFMAAGWFTALITAAG